MRRLLLAALLAAVLAPATAAAAPTATYRCNGSTDCGGWWATPVTITWFVAGGTPSGCDKVTLDRDTPPAGSPQGCTVSDGTATAVYTVNLKVDLTPPAITDVIPDRPPDHNGWYTHPVGFTGQGQDVTSGVAGCDGASYGGPDNAAASVLVRCLDVAGNAAVRAFPFQYDATAPDLTSLAAQTGDRLVQLGWPAAATARVQRRPGLRGAATTTLRAQADGLNDLRVRNGVRYRYVVTVADEAGNTTTRTIAAVPGPHLLDPAGGATLAAPPLLRWTPVRGARYYNVQLFREGKKILSAWPRHPRLQLERRWRFAGDRHRLSEGDYRWFVWPGKGARAERRYGDRIGARRFTVAR